MHLHHLTGLHHLVGLHHLTGLRVYPLVFAFIGIEIAGYLILRKRSYPWREMAASLAIYILRMPVRLLTPLIVAPVAYFVWQHRVATIPLDTAWGVTLLLVGEELAYYWMHRAGHRVRWLWASHVVHHTPEHLHLASALRLGLTEFLSASWLFYLPLYVLGLNPLAVGGMLGLNLLYQFWLHTELIGRLGPIEWIFNTPSHHRVHHASNPEYLDRNYGGILIIWDRLFGTFAEEKPNITISYGIVSPVGSLNPFKIAFHEWVSMAADVRRARSWGERLKQLFGKPGDSLASSIDQRPKLPTRPAQA